MMLTSVHEALLQAPGLSMGLQAKATAYSYELCGARKHTSAGPLEIHDVHP